MTPTSNVQCPNCINGIRKTVPVTVKCGTCWGIGTLTQAELDRARLLAVR